MLGRGHRSVWNTKAFLFNMKEPRKKNNLGMSSKHYLILKITWKIQNSWYWWLYQWQRSEFSRNQPLNPSNSKNGNHTHCVSHKQPLRLPATDAELWRSVHQHHGGIHKLDFFWKLDNLVTSVLKTDTHIGCLIFWLSNVVQNWVWTWNMPMDVPFNLRYFPGSKMFKGPGEIPILVWG